MSSAFFIVLRRMRAPLILLIVIYAVSVFGLTLIPGVDPSGRPWHMDFFHAFYFMSSTATTIGFGEIPYAFTDAQRLWTIFCIYLAVIGWAYAIGTLFALLQNRGFQQALAAQRFERRVQRVGEPFFLVCGYGETGQLLCRSLDHLGLRFVVLDADEARINELELHDYRADAPGLASDVRQPNTLIAAGLTSRHCRGVIALASDDSANLAIAIAARLLNPNMPVLCRVVTPEVAANIASFGKPHIVNPFETFGEYLALAMRSPGAYQLMEWLTGVPGSSLRPEREPPLGCWIICGYGRFGHAICDDMQSEGIEVTIIDPHAVEEPRARHVIGVGTQKRSLQEAGVARAVGIVAATDDDIANLSIVVTARALNPDLFVVLRQNQQSNSALFQAFDADFVVVPSEIIARECLAVLTTPLLSRFLSIVKRQDDAWADAVVSRLARLCGESVPATWSLRLDERDAPAIHEVLAGAPLSLETLLRDPADRKRPLACLPLLLVRAGQQIALPAPDMALRSGDEILFAATAAAKSRVSETLHNANTRDYVLYGKDSRSGWLWNKLRGAAGTP